ncbi:MAG TPA: hypothetical protein VGZ00_10745 [Candidatus Baltobacteraceae bacterium]|jgi:hypothetical protein|nr:hypothetical protein [Candidatus Baltobacteraceae bacterium]
MMKRILSCVLIFAIVFSFSPFALADEAAPVAGDLSHLTFSATSGLWVRLLSPAPESAAAAPATQVEAAVGMDQGVEVRINDEIVSATKIGKRVVDGPAKQTRYTFYGVPLQPGPNRLALTPLGAGNLRGTTVTATIYGPGRPAAFQSEVLGKLVADGSSRLVFRVKATDRWGHPAMAGSLIKASVSGGDVTFLPPVPASAVPSPTATAKAAAVGSGTASAVSSAAPAPTAMTNVAPTPGIVPARITADNSAQSASAQLGQSVADVKSVDLLLVSGGTADVNMVAGLTPGDVIVQLSDGDVKAARTFFLAPNVRAPMVLGLATVGIGQVPGTPGEDPTVADGTNTRRGRVALYATGDIGHDTLGTMAYDTADTLSGSSVFSAPGLSDAVANRPYDIVGDSSMPRDDALSSDHLYLRLDRKRSSFVWGEFQAQTGSADGGDGFNLLVDGAKVELASSATKLMVFRASNNVAYAREIFSPLGLSTLGNLLHPSIVVGSEIVMVVTLDRHSGAILTQTPMTPTIDYSIDYNTGQIRFLNIPLPFDQNFNPNEIVISYEYDGGTSTTKTTGGRFDATFGHEHKEHVGVGYANDNYGTGSFSLLSENLGGPLSGGAWSVEHLSSNGIDVSDQAGSAFGTSGSSGSALRASMSMGGKQNHFDAGFDSTTSGFDNPFGGLSTPGLLDYHVDFRHAMRNDSGQVTLSFSHAQNSSTSGTSSQSQASALWQKKITKRLSVKAGINATAGLSPSSSPSAAPVSSTSIQGDIGFDWKLFPTIDLNVDRTQDIGSGTVASQPAETQAELGVELPRKGRAYVREIWSASPVESFASSTASLTAAVSGTHTTDIGFQRSLGPSTSFSSDYLIQQGAGGTNIYSSVGVDEKLQFGKQLHGDMNLQRAVGIGSDQSGFNLYGLTMGYDQQRLHATGSYQLRTGEGGGSSVRLGATGMLSRDISLLAMIDNSNAAGLMTSDQRVGLAYRPENNDRGVTLLQYDVQTSTSSQLGTFAATLSLDQAFHPTNRLELAGRYAYKLDGDSYYPAKTQLFGFRAVQRIGGRFDIGGETRYLDVRGIPGASETGFALESGVRLGDTMRFALGYNFSAAPDQALAAAPSRRGVYATMTTVIDRILGWGR